MATGAADPQEVRTVTFLMNAVLAFWVLVGLLPWQPWRAGPRLEARAPSVVSSLEDVTVLMPARDEATVIGSNLRAVLAQGTGVRAVVVDDQSQDGTGAVAKAVDPESVTVVRGEPLPSGWTGKLWALEQGRAQVMTPYILLLDADIRLMPGMLPALRDKLLAEDRALVSVMSRLRMVTGWERLLMPPFVWFFRFLYPFPRVNDGRSSVAAAAGGCLLIRRSALERIGGFAAIRHALIDDCALATAVKRDGGRIWLGLTHGAVSQRAYPRLVDVSAMVSRTAYAQLDDSPLRLLGCVLALGALFLLPVVGVVMGVAPATAVLAWGLMALSLVPTLRYYERSPLWAFAFPLAAALYLGMTVRSALRFHFGHGSAWRGRAYGITESPRHR